MGSGLTGSAGTFPIAVVGVACRFPGAGNVGEFWSLLRDGVDAVGPIPEDRWDVPANYSADPTRPGKMYTRDGGFIADIDKFDAAFFGISPREARRIDPQQRILLELTWEAMEDAGIVPGRLAGSQTGVFVGISFSDYAALQREDPDNVDAYVMSGSAVSNAANRISYIFDLHGPSFAVDTACSSSLVAIHEACVSLWRGESGMAVAGGINALLSASGFIGFSKAHMLSPTGRCHAFDASGDGYVRSEGGGVVLLRPLADALADGNPVWAVIEGTGVNSDGRTTGLAMPNPAAQEALLRRVYREAGIDPGTVAYVEAHGTGTGVGDPVECTALGRVFGAARPPGDPCRIGSVKTNIGHLEPASGIAGLLKVLLAMRHRAIPRSLHLLRPNPQIPFGELNLSVVADAVALPPGPLTMGINSFGFGGTNAHVILRSPDAATAAPAQSSRPAGVAPLLISAHAPEALAALADRYAATLRAPDAPALAALCRSAATRRTHHAHRLAVFGDGATEIADRLAAFAAGDTGRLTVAGQAPAGGARLAFVFSGNGSQWRGMGRDLMTDPWIAGRITEIDAALQPHLGWSVADTLRAVEPENLYDRTEYAQPTLFALQVAIVEWLRAHGVEAEAVAGHSVGEVAAAWAAGILPLAEACRVIAVRSQAQGRTAGAGRMAALGMSAADAAAAIRPYGERLTIAGINSPRSVTVAGDPDVLAALGADLKPSRTFYRELALDYAFHSRVMDPIRDELLERLAALAPQPGRLRFASTVTGGEIDYDRLGAAYWWDNIRKPVLFASAIEALADDGITAFLEIGPHPILDAYVRECAQAAGRTAASLATLRRRDPERDALWLAVGRCYTAGAAIDFDALHPGTAAYVPLPAYPWQRERFWFSDADEVAPATPDRRHPLLGKRLPTAEPVWKHRLDPASLPWLRDHVVQGSIVVPGAAYIEMALAAAAATGGGDAIEVENFEIRRPIVISGGNEPAIDVVLAAEDGSFRLHSGETAGSAVPPVAVARVVPQTGGVAQRGSPAAIRDRLGDRIDGSELYRRCAAHGLNYGPSFQGVAEAWSGTGEGLARIVAPPSIADELGDYRIHPAMLDACFHVMVAALPQSVDGAQAALVPGKADRIRLWAGGLVAWCHMRLVRAGARSVVADFRMYADDGDLVAGIDGLRFRRLELAGAGEIPAYHWHCQLQPFGGGPADAGDLPGPQALATAAASCGNDADREPALAALDRAAAAYAAAALAELGGADRRLTPPPVRANGAGPPLRARRIAALLDLAERHGMAERRGADCHIAVDASAAAAETLWRETLARYPAHLPSLQLIARCGESLPPLLREGVAEHDAGPGDAGDAGDILNQLCDADPLFREVGEAAAAVLRSLCSSLPNTRVLRVLEVAGGGGGLTAALAAALPDERCEYVFTDADDGAVARAEARFAGVPALRCAPLDLGRDLAEQGFAGDAYDVVIAGPALAASPAFERSLAVAAELLKPGGLVVAAALGGGFLDLAGVAVPGMRRALDADWPRALAAAGFAETAAAGAGIFVGRRKLPAKTAVPVPGTTVAPGLWAILSSAETSAAAAALAVHLAPLGQRVVTIEAGDKSGRLGLDRFVAPRGDRDGHGRALRLLAADGPARLHLVYLRGLVGDAPADPLAADCSYDLLALVQELIAAGLAPATSLTVATAGAVPAADSDGAKRPWQATLWGIGRTVMNERADIACRLIDLDPAVPAVEAMTALGEELLRPDDENEVMRRGRGRYVPRLRRGLPRPAPATHDGADGFTLAFGHGEAQDRTILHRIAIPRPGPGEVAVRVHAAGVNFRDVLQRIGLLPEEAFEQGFAGPTLGLEFSGEIVAAGEGVDHLRPGDAVFGFGRSAFSSHLVTPAFCLFKKPAGVGFAEAATVPVAAVTVYYALNHLARLAAGERILIHGAAGGVGLAAVQYAQSVGAEIFASAGSPEKRALLRRLGVRHIVDSRTLAFADDIRAMTGGEGVDVVLNSLAGEAIPKGISLLRPYGRFVELGKRDFYANSRLGLQPFRHNIQFFGVDVDTLLVDRPVLARQLFADLAPLLDRGVFSPLPHRVYPIDRAAEAFRSMQQSRHIGKIVVAMTGTGGIAPIPAPDAARWAVSPAATYLVTGGRGGFGLATAEWLASRGGRHLALVGRSQATAPDAAAALDRLRRSGVDIREFAADVADEEEFAKVLARIRRDMPPLRGVVHAAAVIRDVGIVNETADNFRSVLRPKVAGAWNLHRLTLADPLDFFVMYSSAITLFGNEGQANYGAANLYLESLAAHRRGLGLPGLAVAWGAIGEVGHMARHTALTERVKEQLGVRLLAPTRALDRMADSMRARASVVALAEISWTRLARLPAIAKAPKYAQVRDVLGEEASDGGGADAEELRAHLQSLPRDEALAAVQQQLLRHIAGVVGTAPAKLAIDQPLTDLGMDSLMLVELQVGLDKQFGIAIPTLDLMDLATVAKLARRIVDEIGISAAPAANGDATEHAPDPPAIEDLAEPAFELTVGRLLGQELDRAKERPL